MKYLYFITEIYKFVSYRLIFSSYFSLIKGAVIRLTDKEHTE